MSISKTEIKDLLQKNKKEIIEYMTKLITEQNKQILFQLNETQKTANSAYEIATKNESTIDILKKEVDTLKQQREQDLNEIQILHKKTKQNTEELEELKNKYDDLKNRSLRKTLVFRGFKRGTIGRIGTLRGVNWTRI